MIDLYNYSGLQVAIFLVMFLFILPCLFIYRMRYLSQHQVDNKKRHISFIMSLFLLALVTVTYVYYSIVTVDVFFYFYEKGELNNMVFGLNIWSITVLIPLIFSLMLPLFKKMISYKFAREIGLGICGVIVFAAFWFLTISIAFVLNEGFRLEENMLGLLIGIIYIGSVVWYLLPRRIIDYMLSLYFEDIKLMQRADNLRKKRKWLKGKITYDETCRLRAKLYKEAYDIYPSTKALEAYDKVKHFLPNESVI